MGPLKMNSPFFSTFAHQCEVLKMYKIAVWLGQTFALTPLSVPHKLLPIRSKTPQKDCRLCWV